MQIPKSAIFVAGLSIALFLITLLVISITAHQENTAKPQPTEEKSDKILLEYKPNDKIHLILYGNKALEESSKSQKLMVFDYQLFDKSTNKYISYTNWINLDFDPPREAQIKNNKLILTVYEQEFPFLADEFYLNNEKLYHASVIAFNPSDVDTKTLRSIKNKILKYKHRNHNDIRENEMQDLEGMPGDILILALCGDKEAVKLLKDRNAYNKYFNIELDGSFGEVYSTAAGAYETYEYLRNQSGSIKEVIPLDK